MSCWDFHLFTLSLRGQLGTKVFLIVHVLLMTASFLLFVATNSYLQIAIVTVLVIGLVRSLLFMNEKKDELIFNSPINREFAYPSTARKSLAISIFHSALVIIFFLPILIMLIANASLSEAPLFAWIICFYIGSLSLVDLIHICIRKRKSK